MSKVKRVDSKEVGLDIGLIIFKFFLQSENLHYGWWTPDMEAHVGNLKKAQEQYTEKLLAQIPAGVKTILDVGAGSGIVAKKLIELGYVVECVSPSKRLSARIKENTEGKAVLHESTFEKAKNLKKYDMLLFCESYQYIPLKDFFALAPTLLNEGGTVLFCDFFQTDAPGHSPLGGGHKYSEYQAGLAQSAFKVDFDQDITAFAAPTMTCVNDLSLQVIKPTYVMLLDLLQDRYPYVHKFITWKFKKKLEKLEKKHFAGERNAENFIKYKIYKLTRLKLA